MAHYDEQIEAELEKHRRANKPRIRCLKNIYRVYRNEKKARMNHCQHQSHSFELACDMALALR